MAAIVFMIQFGKKRLGQNRYVVRRLKLHNPHEFRVGFG